MYFPEARAHPMKPNPQTDLATFLALVARLNKPQRARLRAIILLLLQTHRPAPPKK